MALPMRNQQRPQPHNHNDSERNVSNNANIPRGAVKLQPRMNRGNAMLPQPSHANNAVRRPQPPLRGPLNENNNANMHNQPPLKMPRNMNANHNVNNMNGNQRMVQNGSFLTSNPNPERRENVALRRNVGRKELNKLEQNPRILRTDIPQVTPSNTKIQNTMIDDNLDFGADDDAIELGEIDMNSNQMLPPSNTPPPDYYDDENDDENETSSYDDDMDDNIDYDAHQDNANNIDNMSDDELFNDSEKPASASSHDISLKPSVNASTPPVPSIPSAIPVPQPNPEIPDVNINNVSKDDGNTPEANKDDSENKKAPLSSLMNVFKSKANDFIRKAKNEIGDDSQPDDENEDDDKDSKDEQSDELKNDPENDSNNNEDKDKEEKRDNPDKPSVNRNNGIVNMIVSTITLPFRMLLFVFNTATQLIRIMLSLVSALTVFILIWLICNIPAAMNQSVPSFDTDEGTLTAKEVSYDDNMITFKAENSSDMIAHAGITADVKAWKPFKKIPVSIFAPVQVQSCESTYVDINPGESKEITLKCTGDSGLWMRPQVHLTGE